MATRSPGPIEPPTNALSSLRTALMPAGDSPRSSTITTRLRRISSGTRSSAGSCAELRRLAGPRNRRMQPRIEPREVGNLLRDGRRAPLRNRPRSSRSPDARMASSATASMTARSQGSRRIEGVRCPKAITANTHQQRQVVASFPLSVSCAVRVPRSSLQIDRLPHTGSPRAAAALPPPPARPHSPPLPPS